VKRERNRISPRCSPCRRLEEIDFTAWTA